MTFKGGHTWASEELLTEAIEWLEIQGMRTRGRPRDENLINDIFIKRVEEARLFEKRDEAYAAFISYRALVADFGALKDMAEFEKAAARLGETREVKAFIKQEKEIQQQPLVRSPAGTMLTDESSSRVGQQELKGVSGN